MTPERLENLIRNNRLVSKIHFAFYKVRVPFRYYVLPAILRVLPTPILRFVYEWESASAEAWANSRYYKAFVNEYDFTSDTACSAYFLLRRRGVEVL